jgi:hypothetical protein
MTVGSEDRLAPVMPRALLVAVFALALPASASAATASMPLTAAPCDIVCSKYGGNPPPVPHFDYTAAPGEANALTLELRDKTLTVRDTGAPVTPGDNCTRVDDHAVTCTAGTTPSGSIVKLGDGDDSLAVTGSLGTGLTVDGGAGDDHLVGGAEPDLLHGGGGHDRLEGGGGADTLADDDAPGGGDADVLDGGADLDTVDYSNRTAGVSVDLGAGTGPDGDTLSGFADLTGGSGDDVLTGTAGDDSLFGGKGADKLTGGPGNDTLEGGPGRDTFDGGPGRDDLATHDGSADTVRCGPGADIVRDLAEGSPDSEYGERTPYTVGPDLADVLALDCERTIFGARLDVDGTSARATPLSVGAHSIVLSTPCRCSGSVEVRPFGAARFTKRSRRVVVRTARRPAGVVRIHWRSGKRSGAWSIQL